MSHQETYRHNEAYAQFLAGWDAAFYANGVLVHDMCGFISSDAIVSGEPPGPPATRVASKEGATK